MHRSEIEIRWYGMAQKENKRTVRRGLRVYQPSILAPQLSQPTPTPRNPVQYIQCLLQYPVGLHEHSHSLTAGIDFSILHFGLSPLH